MPKAKGPTPITQARLSEDVLEMLDAIVEHHGLETRTAGFRYLVKEHYNRMPETARQKKPKKSRKGA